jgi:hypothetical protein
VRQVDLKISFPVANTITLFYVLRCVGGRCNAVVPSPLFTNVESGSPLFGDVCSQSFTGDILNIAVALPDEQ